MKLQTYLSSLIVATLISVSSAFAAGEMAQCCVDTAAKVKDGKACPKCVEHACCKDTAEAEMKKLADAGKKMERCEGCEAKKKS
jgi:hypothetical protein